MNYRREFVLAGGERPEDGSRAHDATIGACASLVRPASARSTCPRPGWTLVSSAEVPTWQTVQWVLDLLCNLATVPVRVERDPTIFRPADAPLMVADITRLRADTGWEPRVPFAQTATDILDFWRQTLDVSA